MIAEKYGPLLFGAILSGLMSLLVSGISTFRAVGPVAWRLSSPPPERPLTAFDRILWRFACKPALLTRSCLMTFSSPMAVCVAVSCN
ncbi:hypothetical protein EGT07_24265 [Herbaspirillum sp. HC18]|nr:hypothetical protein EGT07_24265 [Herbaspirillum sp. HC18]